MKKRDEIIISAIVDQDLKKLDRIAISIIETSADSSKYKKWQEIIKHRQSKEGEGT